MEIFIASDDLGQRQDCDNALAIGATNDDVVHEGH